MEFLAQWVKSIAIFYIIGAIVLNLVPNDSYKKYLKIFIGFILIILLIKPLGQLTGKSLVFDSLLNKSSINSNQNEFVERMRLAEEKRYEMIVDEYTTPIKENIEKCVKNQGGHYMDSTVEINTDSESEKFGNITAITVYLKRENEKKDPFDISVSPEEELMTIEIKNYLSSFYNLDKRNIYVNIS